jgi:hypothetical protein
LTSPDPEPLAPSWAAHQLSEFLGIFSSFDDADSAILRLVERAAEVTNAEAVVLVERNRLVASAGPAAQFVDLVALRAVTSGRERFLGLRGEQAHALAVPAGEPEGRSLVVVRLRPEYVAAEIDLIRGLGRVVALGSRTLSLIQEERGLRASSESQAAENSRLLEALRARQVMLE